MSSGPRSILVLVMTQGMSLDLWRQTGTLAREWAVYERLVGGGGRHGRVVVVTYGELRTERAIAAGLAGSPVVVAGPTDFAADVADEGWLGPACVAIESAAREARAEVVLVKTNQFKGGRHAAGLVSALRERGVRAGLLARAGYDDLRNAQRIHGMDHAEARRALIDEAALCAASSAIVVSAPRIAADLAGRRGLPAGRVRVVPNWVRLEDVPGGDVREREGWMYAGRLEREKRVELLIGAQRVLEGRGTRAPTLEIVGDGSLRDELGTMAGGLSVRFAGRLDHASVLRAMASSAVYAQASAFEGHPKTVIEAMACGAGVVVVDAPGLADVVEHGRTGLVCAAEAGAIAASVDRLMSDRDLRERLGRSAAEAAAEQYGLGAVLRRELEVHEAVLACAIERGRASGSAA